MTLSSTGPVLAPLTTAFILTDMEIEEESCFQMGQHGWNRGGFATGQIVLLQLWRRLVAFAKKWVDFSGR